MDELGPAMVEEGRRKEVELMVKELDMFELGGYEEAVTRGGGADDDAVGRRMEDGGRWEEVFEVSVGGT